MKVEKRTMWLVETGLCLKQVIALYDTDEGKVLVNQYASEDGGEETDWYTPYEGERFFNTESEARAYREERYKEVKEKAKACLELIDELRHIESQDDFEWSQEEFLGVFAKDRSESDWRQKERLLAKEKVSLLASIARSRHFNVNGETIIIDEVGRIAWHKGEKATLYYCNDIHKVTTNTLAEYEVVVLMFGSNRSGVELYQ